VAGRSVAGPLQRGEDTDTRIGAACSTSGTSLGTSNATSRSTQFSTQTEAYRMNVIVNILVDYRY